MRRVAFDARRGHAARRGAGIVIGYDAGIRAVRRAASVVRAHGAAIGHAGRRQGHGARRRIQLDVARQAVAAPLFAGRVFRQVEVVGRALFVTVGDVEAVGIRCRFDDDAALVRRVAFDARRGHAARRGAGICIAFHAIAGRCWVSAVVRHCVHSTVIFHGIRRQFDCPCCCIDSYALVGRNACRRPSTTWVFRYSDSVRLVVFVGIVDFYPVGVRFRGDGYASLFVTRTFGNVRLCRINQGNSIVHSHRRRVADIAVCVRHGITHRRRATGKTACRGEGDFASGSVNRPSTFSRNPQDRGRLVSCGMQ